MNSIAMDVLSTICLFAVILLVGGVISAYISLHHPGGETEDSEVRKP